MLTPRQGRVMECIMTGMNEAEIAKYLFISPKTVRSYRVQIIHRLEANNMAHAVALYLSHQQEAVA